MRCYDVPLWGNPGGTGATLAEQMEGRSGMLCYERRIVPEMNIESRFYYCIAIETLRTIARFSR